MVSLRTGEEEVRRRKRKPPLIVLLLVVLVTVVVLFMVLNFLYSVMEQFPIWGASVALLEIDEPIYNVKEYIKFLDRQRANPAVRAVVIYLECPGGSVGAVQELVRELKRMRQESPKLLVASMGNIATSGAYYVAAATDKIYANPGSITGSIGVLFSLPNWENLIRKIGVKMEVVKSGKYKDIASPSRPLTEDERELLQGVIDDAYAQFLETVVEYRGEQLAEALPTHFADLLSTPNLTVPEELMEAMKVTVADGRIMTGRQAMNYGLVDELGNVQDALNYAAQVMQIPVPPKVIQFKRRRGFWDVLMGGFKYLSPSLARQTPALEYTFLEGK